MNKLFLDFFLSVVPFMLNWDADHLEHFLWHIEPLIFQENIDPEDLEDLKKEFLPLFTHSVTTLCNNNS